MRLLLLSDVHANPWALQAVSEASGPVDGVLCAGDCVNYGPEPTAVVDWLRAHGVITVRGNHDQAVAYLDDPRAMAAKRSLALTLRDWTRAQLDSERIAWLAALPIRLDQTLNAARVSMVHATPVDPLYDYRLRPELDAAGLETLLGGLQADLLVAGHTHLPLHRWQGNMQVVNPGSVGQPLDGDPRAAFALWEDGAVRLCRADYDRRPLQDAIERWECLSAWQRETLRHVVQHGRFA